MNKAERRAYMRSYKGKNWGRLREYKTNWAYNKRHPENPRPLPRAKDDVIYPPKASAPPKPIPPCKYCGNVNPPRGHNCRALVQFHI